MTCQLLNLCLYDLFIDHVWFKLVSIIQIKAVIAISHLIHTNLKTLQER